MRTMLSVAQTDNLSVVMVGPIPWYGLSRYRAVVAIMLASELQEATIGAVCLKSDLEERRRLVDGLGLKTSNIEKFAITDAQRRLESCASENGTTGLCSIISSGIASVA